MRETGAIGRTVENINILFRKPSKQAIVLPAFREVRRIPDLEVSSQNVPPYSFEWVSQRETELNYGAALIRISNEYEKRF